MAQTFGDEFGDLSLEELRKYEDIPPSKSEWPGDESDPESLNEEEARARSPDDLLRFAAKNNRCDIIKSFIENEELSSIMDSRDEDGYSAMHCCAYSNSVEVALLLIEAGAEIEPRSNDGWTPLHSAARWNNDAMASLLLSRGANVNSKTIGNLTPLQLATSEKEMLAVISVLVAEPHCDVTTKNDGGDSALDLARRYCGFESALFCRDDSFFL